MAKFSKKYKIKRLNKRNRIFHLCIIDLIILGMLHVDIAKLYNRFRVQLNVFNVENVIKLTAVHRCIRYSDVAIAILRYSTPQE